jgi:hypothetical protein
MILNEYSANITFFDDYSDQSDEEDITRLNNSPLPPSSMNLTNLIKISEPSL